MLSQGASRMLQQQIPLRRVKRRLRMVQLVAGLKKKKGRKEHSLMSISDEFTLAVFRKRVTPLAARWHLHAFRSGIAT